MPTGRTRTAIRRTLRALAKGIALMVVGGCAMSGLQPADRTNLGTTVVEGVYKVDRLPDRPIRYLRAGDTQAPRILYVHGTPGDAASWLNYLRHPVENRDSWAIDRPGFGGSSLTKNGAKLAPAQDVVTGFSDQAAALEPLLVERQGHKPIVVGHSLGGPIAARLASEHPDDVGALVILAGSLDPAQEKLEWYNDVAQWTVVTWLIDREMLVSNREVMRAKQETTSLQPLLKQVTCPVVIVHGTKDSLVPFANVAYMKAQFTGASSVKIVEISGADHFLPWMQEKQVREAIGDAIRLESERADQRR